MKVARWLGDRLFGAEQNLKSVLVAVVFAPVLPDLFVDWFADGHPERNWWLRLSAVGVVLAVAVLVHFVRLGWIRSRRRRSRQPFGALSPAEVLVVPLSMRPKSTIPNYTRQGRGVRDPEVPEYLCAHTRPSVVIGVISPELNDSVSSLTEEFEADGIRFVPVRIEDPYDPVKVTWDSERVVQAVRELNVRPNLITVDVTGGTVSMTLAMMRVAASLGARCVYVSSKQRVGGGRIPHSQYGHEFDPRIVVESV